MNKSALLFVLLCLLWPIHISAPVADGIMDIFRRRSMNRYEDDKAFEVTIPAHPSSHVSLGMGVQFDPYFFSHNVPMENGAKEEDWDNIIVPRVKSMLVQRYRVGVMPHWWEPFNDDDNPNVMNDAGFTWDSFDMLSLYKVLDLAEETQTEVTLVLWGCPKGASLSTGKKKIKYIGRSFLSDGGDHWMTGPNNTEEFAENFVALIKHLIVVKQYTCVKEITPFNEPESRVVDLNRYVECFKAIHNRLLSEGLRDRVLMNASDNIGTHQWFLQSCVDSLASVADLYNSHTYSFGYKSKNSAIEKWETENVRITSSVVKPHYVGEIGSNEVVNAARQSDIDTFERGVLLCRMSIVLLNAGAAGVSYWSLDDHYTNAESNYANMQQLGLWRYINSVYSSEKYYSEETEDYYARPQYYAYSLMTRFVRKGDEVYPLEMKDGFLAGVALRHSGGTWSYIFANGSNKDYSVRLKDVQQMGSTLDVLEYCSDKLPKGGQQISKSYTIRHKRNGDFNLYIPSNCVILLNE